MQLLTLKGFLCGKFFRNEDGVCYPLEYYLNIEQEVYIQCIFLEDNKTLSVYKIVRIK